MQWLFKQRNRVLLGYQLIGLINLSLLLTQSETLKQYVGATTSQLLFLGLPCALSLVWLLGYILSRPSMQRAEDRANSELMPQRRDIDRMLEILEALLDREQKYRTRND